jgi:DNA-binding transcriptional regulator GbsR (MarR family)
MQQRQQPAVHPVPATRELIPEAARNPSGGLMKSENYQKALDQFVLYWGEMASEWGINRTMAQIHALLFAETEPLDTDAIMQQLNISRGNANMNLRNLMQWGIVHKVHIKGRRKDFYTSEKDVWNTAARIIKERHHREIAPIKNNLAQCVELLSDAAHSTSANASATNPGGDKGRKKTSLLKIRGKGPGKSDKPLSKEAEFRQRIEQFIAFMDLFEDFIETMLPYINEKNHNMLKMLMKMAANTKGGSGTGGKT